MVWKDRIDPELIDLFLDRIYQLGNGSLIEMEDTIREVALSGNFNRKGLCGNCRKLEEVERRENELMYEMEDEMEVLYDEANKDLQKIKKLKEDFTTLKKHSVVFSMEIPDIED